MTEATGSGYEAGDRRLLETTATRAFQAAVTDGGLRRDDPRFAEEPDWDAAVDLLIDIGLLRPEDPGEASGALRPVDPVAVQSRVVVPLGERGAELLAESARWANTFSDLGQVFRTSAAAAGSPITELHGLDSIDRFISGVVNDCRDELLTAQPHGRRPASALAVAEDRDLRALDRGVRMRTLYQHSARHSPATREYVAEVLAHGGEVRTLDEFFRRLIVVDRRVALVPASDNHHVAIAIHDPSLVAYLVDVFDRAWERAHPFDLASAPGERTIAADMRAMTIRMLVEGYSDPASAKRLGVGTRTYAGYIAALKDEYGVQTRFQLGYAMGSEARRPPDPALDGPGADRGDDPEVART